MYKPTRIYEQLEQCTKSHVYFTDLLDKKAADHLVEIGYLIECNKWYTLSVNGIIVSQNLGLMKCD